MMIRHPVPGCSSVSNLPCHQVGISLMLHPSSPFHGPYCRLVTSSDIKTRTDPIDHPSCIAHCTSIFDLSFHVLSSGHNCPAEASHMLPTTMGSGDFIIGLSEGSATVARAQGWRVEQKVPTHGASLLFPVNRSSPISAFIIGLSLLGLS